MVGIRTVESPRRHDKDAERSVNSAQGRPSCASTTGCPLGSYVSHETKTPDLLLPFSPSTTDLEQLQEAQPRFALLFNDAESLQKITEEGEVSWHVGMESHAVRQLMWCVAYADVHS
jgi:hypothetical protein